MAPDPVRDEAERLVAAAIAAVSVAARSLSGGGGRPSFATGTPECCVCPVCRVIAAMREPSPELSERLATGAGDLAAGVTSLLRSFGPRGGDDPEPNAGDEFWESLRRHARPGSTDPWHAATTAPEQTGPAANAGGPARPKPMAKKAMAKKTVKRTVAETTAAENPAVEATVAKRPVAKKAMAKKVAGKRTAAETTSAENPAAEATAAAKPVAKKAAAKKTVAKKTATGRSFP